MKEKSSLACAAFSSRGAGVARKIAGWAGIVPSLRQKDARSLNEARTESIGDWTKARFSDSKAIVFVGATGIAVRSIAPHLRGKDQDPAVIVIDENARFVISLLSGHLGGANELAQTLADFLDAVPVISTATDGRGIFAVDDWARKNSFRVENKEKIVNISSALLEGESVKFFSDAELGIENLPSGLESGGSGKLGICLSPRHFDEGKPFETTLYIRPRILTLGVGCKRNTPLNALESAVNLFLNAHGYSALSVKNMASIDLKADEIGLIELCKKMKWNFLTHSAEELKRVNGEFSRSEFVENTVGVDCVCERAASLHGNLCIRKNRFTGITLALACADWGADF